MARRAGVITIDLNAGTAKFLVDMDQAAAKVREFGKHGVSEQKALSAAMKIVEGDFLRNSRGAEAFLESVLKAGPIVRAAFPVVGAVAFVGTVAEATSKVREFIKGMKESPEKVASAFREMSAPIRQANDDLALANARLENDIAKLEGRRENTLKTMLLEAKSAADKLGESLERDLVNLERVLKENDVGVLDQAFGKANSKFVRKLVGGESGYGGLRGSVATLTSQYRARLDEPKTPEERAAVQREFDARLSRLYEAALGQIRQKLAQAPGVAVAGTAANMLRGVPLASMQDNRQETEELEAVARIFEEAITRVRSTSTNSQLQAKKSKLEADKAAADLTKPFTDKIATLQAQLEGSRAKLDQAGMGPTSKALMEAYGEALKAIADVNKALDQHHQALNDDQKAQIQSLLGTTALTNLQAAWKEKVQQTTEQIEAQARSQEMLTGAIGRGAAAERQARIETRVLGAVGLRDYDDPTKAADVARIRAKVAADVEGQYRQQGLTAVFTLTQELRLQELLTQAQREGEEAVRQVTAAEILRSGIERGLTGQQIALEIQLFYSKLRTQTAGSVARLEAETTATEKLAEAQLKGAEAARQQGLENKYAEMERQGRGAEVPGMRAADEAARQLEITQRVAARVNVYRDEGARLDDELAKLRAIIGANGATVDQARALRDLQRDRLRLWVQEQLAIGTARAGVRAFFAEMAAGSRRMSNVVYENLVSAVDRVSDELSRLFTGQQTDFGRMLREMGQQAVRDSIKLGLERGLGEVGKALGIQMPEGKPDGTRAKPFHVIVDNQAGSSSETAAGLPGMIAGESGIGGGIGSLLKSAGGGVLGFLKGLFGGGKGAVEAVSSSISYMAEGGPVSPSEAYIVGEAGPELLSRTSGYITSNSELRRTLGSGGTTYQMSVDARGAELGVERRVYRAMEAAHRASVAMSVRASHERGLRTPQRQGA